MRILFLTNLLPYPLDNGGKIKTYTTVSSLAEAGHMLDLVCFTEYTPNPDATGKLNKLCNHIEQVPQKLTTTENIPYMLLLAVRSLFSTYSFGMYKYRSKAMEQIILELCRANCYDCIYFDHLQMCVYEPIIRKIAPNAKMILDEHNCEALIMSRNAETSSNPIKKKFLQIETRKLGSFEAKMLQKMDVNIVLSKEDYIELKKQCGIDFPHVIIPIGVIDKGIREEKHNSTNCLSILFLGTLTWAPNNQGIAWFLREVMPLLEASEKKYKLYIVGKNPSAEVQQLAKQYKNVEITGYVESVDEYYDKCNCMIVPLFIGSGQRVKLIEGFSKGMPAVSTSIGAEGLDVIDNDNILIADKSDTFYNALCEMYDSTKRNKLSASARECYERNYSTIAVAEKLNAVINQLYSS